MRTVIARLAAKRRLRVAGLMSGTSADGVDVAIVDTTDGADVRLAAFATVPYAASLRRRVFAMFDGTAATVADVCELNVILGEAFAAALVRVARRAGVPLGSIDLVGSHGQTVCHLPRGRPEGMLSGRGRRGGKAAASTLQIGEPCVIAERTGIATVADFRMRDIAAGGEGAPLVPYTDWILFGHRRLGRAVQNIGGIANVTWLAPGGGVDDVLAFDTGPGNMVIDAVTRLATGDRQTYDRGGRLARRGRANGRLVAELMRNSYFRRRPPKSTGREAFGAEYARRLWDRGRAAGLSAEDIVATATLLAARSIADAYRRHLPAMPDEVILCGGGARNPALVAMLRDELGEGVRMGAMDEWGLSADAKEAVSFAILARESVRGRAGNVPGATGARRRVVLGKIVPGGGRGAGKV